MRTRRLRVATVIPTGARSSGGKSVNRPVKQAGRRVCCTPPAHNVARSSDGGKTWHVTANAPITADGTVGTIFGLAYARDRSADDESDQSSPRATLVVTGPTGAAWSADEGNDWQPLEGVAGFWAVAFADEGTGWLVGVNGTISKITFSRH